VKRIFIVLIALNALFALFIVMQKESLKQNQDSVFKPIGQEVKVVKKQNSIPVVKEVDACIRLGALESIELAEQLFKRLSAHNVASQIVEQEVLASTDFWVIIPPRPSKKQALRLLKQLQLANIDSYIVIEGDYANAISLGLFTVKGSAYGIRDKMIESGYEAVVQEIPRYQKRYWLELMNSNKVPESVLSDVNVEIIEKACKK
jgi:hypothetical protein